MKRIHYVNGSFLNQDSAFISIEDLGLLRGYGVFDYIQMYDGKPFYLEAHLLRLQESAEKVGIELPLSLSDLEQIGYQVIEKNGCLEGALRYVVTAGYSVNHMMPTCQSSLMVMYFPCQIPSSDSYKKGMKLITTNLSRAFPNIKTTNYISAILALKQAQACQADDALYLNQDRAILEATTSNFFAFKNGSLITSDGNEIVKGITRNIILKLSANYFSIQFRSLHYDEIEECEEAFLTSSIKEVMPIIQIDNKKVGHEVAGKKTQFLHELFRQYVKSTIEANCFSKV